MVNERECPTCYQEIEVYAPSADEPDVLYFISHLDLDGQQCSESDEIAPKVED